MLIILDSEPVGCTDWNQRDMLITSCYYYHARRCNVHWMTEGKCPLWLSWTVRLTSAPGSTWQHCQTATHRPWLTRLCARSAAGAWLGSPATLSHLNWGLWMWTSLSTAGSTTISGSQRTWSAPAPPWVEKTPVRCVPLCLCWIGTRTAYSNVLKSQLIMIKVISIKTAWIIGSERGHKHFLNRKKIKHLNEHQTMVSQHGRTNCNHHPKTRPVQNLTSLWGNLLSKHLRQKLKKS